MLAEWEPHEACVMSWCEAEDYYTRRELRGIRAEQLEIARAIAGFEPVVMLVNGDPGEYPELSSIADLQLVQMVHYDT